MTSITDYTAMLKNGKYQEFVSLHYKKFLFKYIDDKRFRPVVKEMMQEEIQKLNIQVQKCHRLDKEQEAKRLEEQIEIYQEILKQV